MLSVIVLVLIRAVVPLFRPPHKHIREASIQTVEPEVVKLAVQSVATQTDSVVHIDSSTGSETSDLISTGIQVCMIVEDSESKYSVLPETPTTCNGSFLPADDGVIPVAARTTSVVSSESSDMEQLLQSAMMSMMSPVGSRSDDRSSNSLFSNVEWGGMERYTTSDTFISGGSIYRTCSEPVPDTFAPNNYWYMGSSETMGSPLNGVGEDQDASAYEYDLHQASADFESRILVSLRPSKEFQITAARLITRLTQAMVLSLGGQVSLVPYGSLASGFALDGAHVDLTLMIPQELLEKLFASQDSSDGSHSIPLHQKKEYEMRVMMKRALMRVVENWKETLGITLTSSTGVGGSITANFSNIKLPSVSIVFENVCFEITCNNLYPMFSTRLAKFYTGLYPNGEIRDLVLAVKAWYGPKDNVGFVLTLMTLFYCQVSKNLFPSLQALSTERKQWKDPFGSRRCDVSFVESVSDLPHLNESTLSLFIGFIQFYANYWNWYSGVISVRLGKIVNIDSPEILLRRSPIDKQRVLHIEDPFDSKKDLGNITITHEMYKCFQKTYLKSSHPSLLITSFNE